MKKQLLSALGLSLCLGGGAAWAEGITFNGFLTAGATYGDSEVGTQDGNINNNVEFTNDTRIGIQLSAEVNPRVDVTAQLLARAKEDNSDVVADWAFVSYKLTDPLKVRAGKLKLPTFLISDYIEVGYAYPWIRPPQEVYFSNPISTINGVDLLYNAYFGDFNLLIQPYFGQSKGGEALIPQEVLPLLSPPPPPGTVAYLDFTAEEMKGINLSIGTDFFTVRAGYLETKVNAPFPGIDDDDVEFYSLGATLDWRNIVIYGETFERKIDGVANLAFPNQRGSYATLGYRIGKVLPHVTYAQLDEYDQEPFNPAAGYGQALEQESVTVGLRYELGSGAALKLEAQRVEPEQGTRGLLIGDPNDPALDDPSKSVNIYSIAIDVVF